MMQPGSKNSITDVRGVLVGNSHDEPLKSGVTVFSSEKSFTASYCVIGGAPGTRETDLLDPDKTVTDIDALVLSGGSTFGLDAASGVVDQLRKLGRGFKAQGHFVPLVPTAILFDLNNGGQKNWEENPYPYLGRQAFDALSRDFDIGSAGAGFGAQCGMMKGGLGSASFVLPNGITVGALVAANPIGNPTDLSGKYFWAAPFEVANEFGGLGAPRGSDHARSLKNIKLSRISDRENTSIGIVATDAVLSKAQAKRLATTAHDGFSRAIVPSHLPMDGDLIFAASTNKIALPLDPFSFSELCHAASLCISRSIARGVYYAKSYQGDYLESWQVLNTL